MVPKVQVEKAYEVKVKGVPPEEAIKRLRTGIVLEDGQRTAPAKIRKLEETAANAWFEVVLHEGRNQQIRRMFDAIGHSVLKLRRSRIGFLTIGNLRTKEWQRLTPQQAGRLMRRTNRGGQTKKSRVRAASHNSGAP